MGGSQSQPHPVEEQPSEPVQQESSESKAKEDLDQEKKKIQVKLPHNFESIVKDADFPIDNSSMDKLYDQLYAGVWLNHKKKKYWVEKKSNTNCFMLLARDLSITWGEDKRFWHWPSQSHKDTTSDVFIEVAQLLNICWLEVHGKFNTTNLSPGSLYETVFVIMLKDPAYGWEVPVNFRLILPDGSRQEHKENLIEKPREKWIEIPIGEFKPSVENGGEMECSMYEYEGGKWKRGLLIKGIVIRPRFGSDP